MSKELVVSTLQHRTQPTVDDILKKLWNLTLEEFIDRSGSVRLSVEEDQVNLINDCISDDTKTAERIDSIDMLIKRLDGQSPPSIEDRKNYKSYSGEALEQVNAMEVDLIRQPFKLTYTIGICVAIRLKRLANSKSAYAKKKAREIIYDRTAGRNPTGEKIMTAIENIPSPSWITN